MKKLNELEQLKNRSGKKLEVDCKFGETFHEPNVFFPFANRLRQILSDPLGPKGDRCRSAAMVMPNPQFFKFIPSWRRNFSCVFPDMEIFKLFNGNGHCMILLTKAKNDILEKAQQWLQHFLDPTDHQNQVIPRGIPRNGG